MMDLNFQKNSVEELQQLANSDRHSILIEGPSGCGKSYLARYFGKMKNITDILFIKPNVQDLRDALDMSYNLTSQVIFCVENLDLGVPSASYTLLKFLEEPTKNVYIIVTCRNRFGVPDTIISRCTCISVSSPVESDINVYAEHTDATKYATLKNIPVWKGVKGLTDVDYVYKMKSEHIDYFRDTKSILNMKDSISTMSWKIGHYPDNSEANVSFVLNYLISVTKNKRVQNYLIQCIRELSTSRISQHAVLSKFLFDLKYGV